MRPSSALWMVACALVGVVAAELAWPSTPAPPPPPSARDAAAAASAVAEPVAAWTATILARPLFDPNRRPAAAAPVTTEATPDAPGLPRLAGIMIDAGNRRAIFSDGGDRSTVAAEGTTIGAWRVVAIRPADVDLDGPDGRHTIRPSFSNAPPPADTAPKPFSLIPQPSGAAIFTNMPGQMARKPR